MSTNNFLDQALALHCDSKLKTLSTNVILSIITDEESQKHVAAKINNLLTKSTTKIQGLELMNSCLPHFSTQIIAEYGPNWLKCCLNHHDEDRSKETYLNTMANIITYSQNHPEFSKKFVSDYLNHCLETSLKTNPDLNVKEASLKCFVSCLSNYAVSCNSYKKKIEEYVLSLLNISSQKLVTLSGLVFFYCQQIGAAGSDGNNHTNNITVSIRRLCVTSHKLFDTIFEHQVEFDRYESNNIDPFETIPAPIHYNTHLKLQYYTQLLKNSLNWITIMLRKSTIKIIYPQEILSIIRRGISLHMCLKQDNISMESAYFSQHLLGIQVELLKVLEVLIKLMGSLLAPFYHTISKIILDLISRGQSCNCYKDNIIQVYLYNVMSVWLKMAKNGFDNLLQDKLVASIIKDAFPVTTSVTLKIDTKLKGKSPKMKRKSLQNKMLAKNISSDVSSVHSREYELTKCFSALNTLHILLDNTYLSLSDLVLIELQTLIINTILFIQRGQAQFPFNNQKNELILYEIVCAIFEQDSIEISIPIKVALNVFQNGLKHENQSIAETCSKGLNILEKICQPACPSLYTTSNKRERNGDQSLIISEREDSIDNEHILPECEVNNEKEIAKNITILSDVIVPEVPNSVIDLCEMDDDPQERLSDHGLIICEDQGQLEENTITHMNSEESLNLHLTPDVCDERNNSILPDNGSGECEPTTKKRKLKHDNKSPDTSIIDCFVDLVNEDYE